MHATHPVKIQEQPATGPVDHNQRVDRASYPTAMAKLRRSLLVVFPFQVVLTMVLVILEFMLSRRGMADPDIWWHLRNAANLLQNHQLPRHDTYSFTVAGHAWINHEWLAEVPYYFAWRSFGLVGVKSLSVVLIVLIFLGLLYLCHQASGNFPASVAACAFTTFLATVSFGPRTILFGYGYLVVLLILLERFRRQGDTALWALPPLFGLWINTHGSWLLGLVIFSIIVAAGLVKGSWGSVEAIPWTSSQFRKLAVTWAASVAALFVNPFGYRLVLYPFDLAFRQKLNIAYVAEWVSVDFHTLRGKLALVLIVVLLLTALVRRRRWSLSELVLLLFALYSGLTYTRFLFLFAIVAAPLLAKTLDFFPPYRPELETPLVNSLAVGLMLTAIVFYWPRTRELQQSVDQEYPSQALPFLKAHPPAGPMLNFYLWGGYLGWNNKDLKVFVDSRVDIFEYAGVLQDYLDVLGVKDARAVLEKYKIRYVLFPKNEPFTYLLQESPEWKVLYSDELCVLLERGQNQSNAAGMASGR